MTDPQRSDRNANAADLTERDREARIEELLVLGLDHYFNEQYELAINVWTRVLFIDRGHARARAYIERARSALAERQRKGDELLHTGEAAFGRGDADSARALITSAVEHGASRDEALALLARIERLEAASSQTSATLARQPGSLTTEEVTATTVRRSRVKWVAAGLVAGLLLGAAAVAALVQRDVIAWPLSLRSEAVAPAPLTTALPVPSVAELSVSRAVALHQRGRLHEALAVLDTVPYGDPLRRQADELKVTIQRELLGARGAGARRDAAGRRP
jgi:hypothetical protein